MPIAVILSSLVFFIAHSLLASHFCKRIASRLGVSEQSYRRAYVVFALLTTLLWLAFIHGLPDQMLYHFENPTTWLLRLTQLGGFMIFFFSLLPIDGLAFLGLRSNQGPLDNFVEAGIYRHIRHPMYSGIMLIMLATPDQSLNGLTLYILISLYLILGSRLEENRLLHECPAYADYRHRVPAFIPRLSTFHKTQNNDS